MFDGEQDLAAIVEDVARVGARLLLQTALEAEIDEFLGRSRYQRSATAEDARPGMRNGYHEITVKTTAGPVRLARPKLRGTTEAFASRLLGAGVSKSNALESLVIAGFVRGLSVRDVQATLAEALGAEAVLSKSTASRICQQIAEQFDTWRTRRLDLLSLDYLFLDGSHFKMHPGSPAEPILAAWGITTDGKAVLVGLEVAAGEGADAWDGFLDGLADRGLRAPLLAISDGAAGLMGAIEGNLPHALRQRCLVHRARNLLAKVPKNAQEEVKAAYWAIFDVPFPGLGRARPRLRRLARVHHDPRRAAPAARPAPPTPRPANRVPPTTRGATRRTRRRHPSRNRHSRGKHAQRDDHVRRHLHHTWEATARPDHMTARSNQPLARNSSVAWDSRAVHEPEAGSRVGQGERDRP